MEYEHFLFYCLVKDIQNNHPLRYEEYDIAFESIKAYYKRFRNSQYNDVKKSEYECIKEYLEANYP